MTKLVGIDHRAARLDHASATSSSTTPTTRPSVSYITAPGWPLTQASRWEAPRVRPRRSRPTSSRMTRCRPASGFPITCALPPPPVGHHVGREHAEQRVHVAARGGLEEPAGEFLAFLPPGRGWRAVARLPSGGDALPGAGEDVPAVHLGLAGDPRHIRVAVPEHLAQHAPPARGPPAARGTPSTVEADFPSAT